MTIYALAAHRTLNDYFYCTAAIRQSVAHTLSTAQICCLPVAG